MLHSHLQLPYRAQALGIWWAGRQRLVRAILYKQQSQYKRPTYSITRVHALQLWGDGVEGDGGLENAGAQGGHHLQAAAGAAGEAAAHDTHSWHLALLWA